MTRPLQAQLHEDEKIVNLDDTAIKAFSTAKGLITKATVPEHQDIKAPISIIVDTSYSATRRVLQQWENNTCYPLAFFSGRLQDSESKSSTFGRERLAIHVLCCEALSALREFTLSTDQKLFTFSLS